MESSSLITDEMRRDIGVEWEPYVQQIDSRWIRKFAEAVGDPNPQWCDEAKARKGAYGSIVALPTFYDALDPQFRHGEVRERWEFPAKLKGGVRGADEVELFEPIRPGDTITATARISDIYERQGKAGRLLFIWREVVYTNQLGEMVARSRSSAIRIF